MSAISHLTSNVGILPAENGQKNEDFATAWQKDGTLFQLIADGNGATTEYNPATFCANEIRRFCDLYFTKVSTAADAQRIIGSAVYTANRVLLAYKKANGERYTNNSFTTLTMSVILPNNQFVFAHCGNSRLYLVRNERIVQLTKDHTEAQKLCDEGKLKKEEVAMHPDNLTLSSALGFETPRIDIMSGNLQKGDILVMLTDGVHNVINLDQLHDIIFQTGNCKDACDGIVQVVNALGAPDNYSAIFSFITE